MGLPAKCMHFVGSPGWHAFCGVPGLEGEIKITPETNSLFKVCLIPSYRTQHAHMRTNSINGKIMTCTYAHEKGPPAAGAGMCAYVRVG